MRGLHALFPPSARVLKLYYEKGFHDAERYLRKEGMWEENEVKKGMWEDTKVSTSTADLCSTSTTTMANGKLETIV